VKQYYGRTEGDFAEGVNYHNLTGREGMNGGNVMGGRYNNLKPPYDNGKMPQYGNDQYKMPVYNSDGTKMPPYASTTSKMSQYNGDPSKQVSQYPVDPSVMSRYNLDPSKGSMYSNEPKKMGPYANDQRKMSSYDTNMAYDDSPGKIQYDTDISNLPYSESQRLPYDSDPSKMMYNSEYQKMNYNDANMMKYGRDHNRMNYNDQMKPSKDTQYGAEDPSASYGNERYMTEKYGIQYNSKSYECLMKRTALQLHKQRVNALCVSSKHNIFITGGLDQTINIVDTTNFRVSSIKIDVKSISDIKLKEDTSELLVAGDNDIYVYRLEDCALLRVLNGHKCAIKSIEIENDLFFTNDVEGELKKWRNYELMHTYDIHVKRFVVLGSVLLVSDSNRVYTYDHEKYEAMDTVFEESAIMKKYDDKVILFFKNRVLIVNKSLDTVNVIVTNEKVQSGCILGDNGILLGFYQGMQKHLNGETFNVSNEGSLLCVENMCGDNEIVIGGCYDGSVVVWEHH